MAFWIHLAAAPREQSESTTAITVWKVVLRTLGSVSQLGQPVGAVLADMTFPKDRMSRLLTATGGALIGAIDEAGRWLMSHDVAKADLSALLALGLGDALSDAPTTAWSRRHLALDYVRTTRRQQAAAFRDAS